MLKSRRARPRRKIRLGVNIDHVATLRQARRGIHPNLLTAALECEAGGADQITIHLREDRRHIQDSDLPSLQRSLKVPLNLEMALHPEIIQIALKRAPEKVCFVPERRAELTTEGGLDAASRKSLLKRLIPQFARRKIKVSLFIDPSPRQILAARAVKAHAVELHTGSYANASGKKKRKEWNRIYRGARLAARLGMHVHAGHGLDYENVAAVAAIPEIEELNIGHAIVSRAVFTGLRSAVRQMKRVISRAR